MQMLNIEYAPERGMIYALYVDKMIYESYENKQQLTEYLAEEKLLEMHLFDREKELRFLKTGSDEIKSYEIKDSEEYDDVYVESSYLLGADIDQTKDLKQKVEVVNYIRYDENDLLNIVNYRLKEAE